jgi:hypothetical protein
MAETLAKLQSGVTPPIAMGGCFSFSPENLHGGRYQPDAVEMIGYGLFGLVCWLVVAAVLWFVTHEAFRTTTGRTPLRFPDYPRSPRRPGPQETGSTESILYAEPME